MFPNLRKWLRVLPPQVGPCKFWGQSIQEPQGKLLRFTYTSGDQIMRHLIIERQGDKAGRYPCRSVTPSSTRLGRQSIRTRQC